LERIGHGGSSIVYLARQQGLDRPVAVKVLSAGIPDPDVLHRFQRESRLTSRLTGHPNAVTVLDTGMTAGGQPYITMEYFPGGSLKQRLASNGPLPVPEVLRVGVKVAGALAAAHAAGVLHRDVKPENILLSRYGEPALADFGVARLDVYTATPTSTHALTPYHAAPEVLDGRPATAASDVYSLGSTLYQLLAGRPAFQPPDGEGIASMLLRVLREEPPPVPRADVPPAVLAVVRHAMAKRPSDRYPDAAAFGTALQEVQAELGLPLTELPYHPGAEAGWPAPPVTVDPDAVTPVVPDRLALTADREAARTVLRDGRRLSAVPSLPPAPTRSRRRLLITGLAALLVMGALLGLRVGLANSDAPRTTSARSTMDSPSAASSAVPAVASGGSTVPSPAVPSPAASSPATPSPAAQRNTQPTSRATGTTTGSGGGLVTPALLGRPDFNGYCQATGQGAVTLVANNAYGWHCSADNGTGDDAEAVCGWTFSTTKVTNRVANFNDPTSWQCWRANRRLGALDFNAYCVDTGRSGAYTVPSKNAYGWFCNGSTSGIDAQAACSLLYGSDPAISRFQNFYNLNSWECWG
jgi:serine/threonine protein kinase